MTDIKQQLQELVRGAEEVLPDGALEAKLKLGRPLVARQASTRRLRICTSAIRSLLTRCASFRNSATRLFS